MDCDFSEQIPGFNLPWNIEYFFFRFTPEAFDWLFEQEKESVDLLKWLTKTLSADTHLSEDQLESYNQIPFR